MRVNGALLGKCVNKRVSMFGTVDEVSNDSKSFSMYATDGFVVTIHLQQPLTNDISGLIEVHGTAQGPTSVSCDYFVAFSPDLAKTFDAVLDNEAVNIGYRISNAWRQ